MVQHTAQQSTEPVICLQLPCVPAGHAEGFTLINNISFKIKDGGQHVAASIPSTPSSLWFHAEAPVHQHRSLASSFFQPTCSHTFLAHFFTFVLIRLFNILLLDFPFSSTGFHSMSFSAISSFFHLLGHTHTRQTYRTQARVTLKVWESMGSMNEVHCAKKTGHFFKQNWEKKCLEWMAFSKHVCHKTCSLV